MPRPLEKITVSGRRLPDWFRRDLEAGQEAPRTDALIRDLGLHTICESGRCPNRNECYSHKTATFMILGDICTRSCKFCSVSTGRPAAVDSDEPRRLALAAKKLGLRHAVVTSVDRDDLDDEGAFHFADTIRELRNASPDLIIEVLTPDFKRTQPRAVQGIAAAGADIFGHNVETVPRLYRDVRPQAFYDKSLQIFREISRTSDKILSKSGLMLGLGETSQEVSRVLRDLRDAGCQMLTLGQYLRSSSTGIAVSEYVTPERFEEYKSEAFQMGFLWVESGPYVRSSYHAGESFESLSDSIEERRHQDRATESFI